MSIRQAHFFALLTFGLVGGSGCSILSNAIGDATASIEPAPEAAASDPDVESEILAAAKRHAQSEGWKEEFRTVRLSSTDWRMSRNEYTGIIVGRTRPAWVGATWPDGHCTFQDFSFYQEMQADDFGGPVVLQGVGPQKRVECSALEDGS